MKEKKVIRDILVLKQLSNGDQKEGALVQSVFEVLSTCPIGDFGHLVAYVE